MATRIPLAATAFLIAVLGCGRDESSPAEPGYGAVPTLATASNTWITRADLLSNQESGMTAATLTNSLGQSVVYVMGGKNATGGSYSKLYAYNASTNKWTKKAPDARRGVLDQRGRRHRRQDLRVRRNRPIPGLQRRALRVRPCDQHVDPEA